MENSDAYKAFLNNRDTLQAILTTTIQKYCNELGEDTKELDWFTANSDFHIKKDRKKAA